MLILHIGFGTELEVYRLCRKVWDLHLETSDLTDVIPLFVTTGDENQSEEVVRIGFDLFIRPTISAGKTQKFDRNNLNDGLVASDWSKDANVEFVARQKKSMRWIAENYGEHNPLTLSTTITSLYDIRVLKHLCEIISKTGTYAGVVGKLSKPLLGIPEFTFVSGANTLFSLDVLQQTIDDHEIDLLGLPTDVWFALRLKKTNRQYLPRYDLEREFDRDMLASGSILAEINSAVSNGHYHFRVKGSAGRELDHLVLLEIYKVFNTKGAKKIDRTIKLAMNFGV